MTRLRVGVDVRGLAPPITGTGVVVRELMRRLVDRDDLELVGYSTRPVTEGALPEEVALRLGSGPSARWGSVWVQTGLSRRLEEDGIDLFWGPLQILPLRARRDLPMVVTLHDLVFRLFPETMSLRNRLLLPRLVPPSLRRADLVTVVSESTGRAAQSELGVPAEKIRLVPNAVGERFAPSETPRASDRLLFVGTREPRKNLGTLLEALAELVEGGRWQGELALVGLEGWGGGEIEDRLRRLGDRLRITFLGYAAESDLPEIYRSSRLLVMPSLYEGFGLPVLEAMASGVPVVCSDVDPFPEITGEAALRVPPRDTGGFAEAIERAWSDETLRAGLREAGLAVAELYSWERSADRLAEVFREAVSRRS